MFPFSAPRDEKDFIKQEREADERRRRELVQRIKLQEMERVRSEEKKESETRAKFRTLGSKSLDVAKALGRNAKQNLTSPETKRSLKRTGRSALKTVQTLSKNYESNFGGSTDFSYNPFQTETKKGKKSDPIGSGLDMDAYLNSYVPQQAAPAKKSKKAKSDIYDPMGGLDYGGYLENFSNFGNAGSKKQKRKQSDLYDPFAGLDGSAYLGGSSKSKKRSKDPIGQFFY
jgi:hypothetical protein